MTTTALTEQVFDAARAAQEISDALRHQVGRVLGRSGLVVAMSGGVDSAVCAALAAAAMGRQRVLGLGLPEHESDPHSLVLAREWAAQLGIDFLAEDITPVLDACGCYARRDAAVRRLVPEYEAGWRCKLVLDNGGLDSDRLNVCYLVIQPPDGEMRRVRLPARELREIVAATNFKQRIRTMLAYHHADRLSYAVVGTPNRLEYDQGFFVKGGDGLADVKPIAHLYKRQVYQLAELLGVPQAIRARTPTTDTYPLAQTQQEFFFALPLRDLDLVLQARNEARSAAAAALELGYRPEEIKRAYREIGHKRRVTRHLHVPPLLVEPVPEVEAGAGEVAD
jgi:NAD+ synthase